MSRYSDEKNPYLAKKNKNRNGAKGCCKTCDGWENGNCIRRPYTEPNTVDCPACTFSIDKFTGYREGYLAAEKEYALTGEEKELFLFMVDYCASYVTSDEAFDSLKNKVLGE